MTGGERCRRRHGHPSPLGDAETIPVGAAAFAGHLHGLVHHQGCRADGRETGERGTPAPTSSEQRQEGGDEEPRLGEVGEARTPASAVRPVAAWTAAPPIGRRPGRNCRGGAAAPPPACAALSPAWRALSRSASRSSTGSRARGPVIVSARRDLRRRRALRPAPARGPRRQPPLPKSRVQARTASVIGHHLSSTSSSRSSSSISISSLKSTWSGTCTLKRRPPRSNSTSLFRASASARACRRAAASSRLSRAFSEISTRSIRTYLRCVDLAGFWGRPSGDSRQLDHAGPDAFGNHRRG